MRFLDRFMNTGWKKVLLLLCAVAVFITTYALILPAITIDKDAAVDEPGMEIVTQDSETTEEDGLPPEDAEPSEDESAEPSEDAPPAELPPVQLNERNGDLIVSVDAGEGVLPEGARLVLNPVDGTPWQDSIENAVDDAVEKVRAVEIGFETAEGEPVQPLDSFTLTVTSAADDVLMTLDGNGAAVLPDGSGEMTVDPDGVPVVALVETGTLTTTYLSASGKEYTATVTFTERAKIPADARLRLTEIKEDSAAFDSAKQIVLDSGVLPMETEDAASEDTHSVALVLPLDNGESEIIGMDVLDLSILDADGNEIEPAAPVQVEITMKALPKGIEEEEFVSSVKVTHLRETGEEICAEVVAENGSGTPGKVSVEENAAVISFETDSFSYYTVTWTFRSNNRTYYRSSNIHYGYMSGGQFVEFPNGTPGNNVININSSHSPAFLIYDVPGYQFDSAHLDSATGTDTSNVLLSSSRISTPSPNRSITWSRMLILHRRVTSSTGPSNIQNTLSV